MTETKMITTSFNGPVATIWLNRPERHNALNMEMISGFLDSLEIISDMDEVRVIIIRGKGKTFCSGADLDWMLRSSDLTEKENLKECEALASCFYKLYHHTKITVCFIHGTCMGGANGILSACDLAVAEVNTVLGFPEVHVGILPATIAPYLIQKTGRSAALELMITGRKFTAEEARMLGLIHHLSEPGQSEDFLDMLVSNILKGSPGIQKQIKDSLFHTEKLSADQSVIYDTASLLAFSRISPEAREGINAFRQKRKPVWYKEIK